MDMVLGRKLDNKEELSQYLNGYKAGPLPPAGVPRFIDLFLSSQSLFYFVVFVGPCFAKPNCLHFYKQMNESGLEWIGDCF
ncbi:unnamed protein product [Nezara viridula]|uniref:Uncharacterized protein n=1 Tax=Nezara viridula TaxID=85310 RepID=A0A9P0HCX1_NEZVI|nr:unnamed protein product [Nezara viridula]